MKSIKGIILTILPALLLSLCPAPSEENDKDMDIRGKITKINRPSKEAVKFGRLGAIMVEGSKPDGTEYKASVKVTGGTVILKQIGMVREKAGFNDLREGLEVEVKFKGPVMMSYPVQAEAGEILIVEEAGKGKR